MIRVGWRNTGVFLFAIMTTFAASPDTAWKTLPPLPDPVGFGGMFAGVSDGVLFAGGGSRFIDKPVWNGGTKVFSDKVFVLKSPDGPWEELKERLPKEMAHSASAPYGSDVIAAGGMNGAGALRDVYRIGLKDGALQVAPLPPLPHPIVYGAAAVVKDVLYVIGGVPDATSTQPGRECWTLSLASGQPSEWTRVPDFPGKPGIVMAAAGDGRHFYVFGGMHFLPSDDGKTRPVPQDNAYRYDPASRTWTQLEDMPFARVGAATPCALLPDGDILVAGGYGFVFSGPQKEHPGFERETLIYSPVKNIWKEGPSLPCERKPNPDLPSSPGPEPMVAAPAVTWQNLVVLISGEVRPATRTPAVVAIPLSDLP